MNTDNLILRQTDNLPLINKDDTLTSEEFDANVIKIYDDFLALSNANDSTLAFDVDRSYLIGEYSTYGGRMWIATNDSTGSTPTIDSYDWQDVFPTVLAHEKNKDTILDEGGVNETTVAEIRAFIDAGLTSTTNLSLSTKTPTSFKIESSTGTDVTIPQATDIDAGLLNATDKVKLNNLTGINSGDQTLVSLNAEDVDNKATDFTTINDTLYPTTQAVDTYVTAVVPDLVETFIDSNVELTTNKVSTFEIINDTVYPSVQAVSDQLDYKVDKVVGSRLITSAESTLLGNTSGTNTGDQIISDATITTTDITTNNFSTTKHGFVPKGTNVGNFLKDDGTWEAVASAIPQTNTIYVDSVNGVNATTGRGDINKPYLTPEYALGNITNTGTVTATTTSTSATLTAVSDTTNIKVGQYITGTGIPYGSLVVSKTSNTIVLSKACTASATITATWWTIYDVMLIGDFTVASNIYKHGFTINADVYKATINFGAITLFNVLTQPLIPIYVYLNVTNGTSVSSVLFNTNNLSLNGGDMYFYYGSYYSIGTAVQIGSAGNKPAFSGDVSFKGLKFDARFGSILACAFSGNFSWQGENSYGLLGGISQFGNYSTNKFYFNDNLTTPASVNAISSGQYYDSNICGNINGSTSLGRCYRYNVYANLNGTTHALGDDGGSTYVFSNYYGNITGTINAGGYLNFYGILTGNLNTVGTLTSLAINGIISGTITCSGGNVFCESTTNVNGSISVVIGAGKFTHNGNGNFTTISYTGTGTFTNNGTINCFVGANNAPSFTLSSGGKFINNGTIKCTSECAAIFDKSASSTLINNGIMTNPLAMYVRYGTNSSPSRDLIIGNSICDGNLYGKPSTGCGTVNKFNVILANTNTSVDIFDGTNTVTISVVGAGKTIAVICQEIVTLIRASILRYQAVTSFGGDRVIFVNVTGTTPTFTNLVNINSVGTYNGGGGFTANVLAAGTELASSFYSNF